MIVWTFCNCGFEFQNAKRADNINWDWLKRLIYSNRTTNVLCPVKILMTVTNGIDTDILSLWLAYGFYTYAVEAYNYK